MKNRKKSRKEMILLMMKHKKIERVMQNILFIFPNYGIVLLHKTCCLSTDIFWRIAEKNALSKIIFRKLKKMISEWKTKMQSIIYWKNCKEDSRGLPRGHRKNWSFECHIKNKISLNFHGFVFFCSMLWFIMKMSSHKFRPIEWVGVILQKIISLLTSPRKKMKFFSQFDFWITLCMSTII